MRQTGWYFIRTKQNGWQECFFEERGGWNINRNWFIIEVLTRLEFFNKFGVFSLK